jgi:hypothetical protein
MPTQEDAKLILHLYELRREARLRQARDWFVRSFHAATMEEFSALCPPGSEANASFRMLVGYWEMAASFVVHGLLDREMFFENNQELLLVWERVRELLPHAREANKNPAHLRHIEQVAGGFIEWWNARAPEFHATFAARIRQRPTPPTPSAPSTPPPPPAEVPHTD